MIPAAKKALTPYLTPLVLLAALLGGCAPGAPLSKINGLPSPFSPETIVDTCSGQAVTRDQLLTDLATVDIVYIGEVHNDARHHEIQLEIIRGLTRGGIGPAVAMEMFDRTYQPVLDEWSAGNLDEKNFLQRTHWYANWRYSYDLYRNILDEVQRHHLPLFGLNIPFHIPAKIAIGGIDSLLPPDRRHLPGRIDTSDTAHREYVAGIFKHHRIRGRENFEFFYQAQCVWEDAMAEAVAQAFDGRPMAVLAGNGHLIYKFGIPDRVYHRRPVSFRTVYLARAGASLEQDVADYVWITPAPAHRRKMK